LKGLIEASDVTIPSCFIIVNRRLDDNFSPAKKRSSVESISNGRRYSAASNSNDTFDNSRSRGNSVVINKYDTSLRWIDKLSKLGEAVAGAVNDPIAAIQEAAKNICTDEFLYLYLVDEYTMQPVVKQDDPLYPIEITTPAEFIPKVLPLLKIGMKAMTVVNSVAGMGRFFGYPVPTIPAEYMSKISGAIGGLDQLSSVAEFNALQAAVDDTKEASKAGRGTEDSKKLSGAALRELERFFLIHDPNCYFSDLRRVLTEDGICIWTNDENFDEMQGLKSGTSTIPNRALSPTSDPTKTRASVRTSVFGVVDVLSGIIISNFNIFI
jgi:hypothetical protein